MWKYFIISARTSIKIIRVLTTSQTGSDSYRCHGGPPKSIRTTILINAKKLTNILEWITIKHLLQYLCNPKWHSNMTSNFYVNDLKETKTSV